MVLCLDSLLDLLHYIVDFFGGLGPVVQDLRNNVVFVLIILVSSTAALWHVYALQGPDLFYQALQSVLFEGVD